MDQYLIYLRKSRADDEAEERGEGDTLARHRTALAAVAKKLALNVTATYEEVVSGETIAARPKMQQLLAEVEQGLWQGVLVMEVERLARGDTIDQGIVAQAFRYSNTKIITPMKTYDPNNEFDEEYFEFGLFMSRREYKTINRRLQRGRVASVKEGKFVANKAPYGYKRVKLTGEKGWSLEPIPGQAAVIKNIFDWFCNDEIGTSTVVRRLNESGILSPSCKDWTVCVIREILANPAYCGKIRWGFRPQVKRVIDGTIRMSTPRAKPEDYLIVPGRHEAIITEEQYAKALERLAKNKSRSGPKQYACKNPLAGLVYCKACGRAMVRRPYNTGYPDGLMCIYTSCQTVSSPLAEVEEHVLDALRDWLKQLEQAQPKADKKSRAEISLYAVAITAAEKEFAALTSQLNRAYELVEQNIYTSEIFTQRSQELIIRRELVAAKKARIQNEQRHQQELLEAREKIIPMVQTVLGSYHEAPTPAEKNDLLKSVIERVIYSKTTRQRSANGSDMAITIVPKLPK